MIVPVLFMFVEPAAADEGGGETLCLLYPTTLLYPSTLLLPECPAASGGAEAIVVVRIGSRRRVGSVASVSSSTREER